MYNSIHQFNGSGVKNIEKVVQEFICEPKNFADLVFGLQGCLFKLGRDLLEEIMEDMNMYIKN